MRDMNYQIGKIIKMFNTIVKVVHKHSFRQVKQGRTQTRIVYKHIRVTCSNEVDNDRTKNILDGDLIGFSKGVIMK